MTGEKALKELLVRIDICADIKDALPPFRAGINIVKLLIDRLLYDIKQEKKKKRKHKK